MSNDPASGGEQPGWQGQQPYPGGGYGQHGDQPAYPGAAPYGQHGDQPGSAHHQGTAPYGQHGDQPGSAHPGPTYGQHGDQPGAGAAYPGSSYPPPNPPGGYGQAPPPWAPQQGQPGAHRGPGWPGGQPGQAGHGGPAGLGPGGVGQQEPTGTLAALFDFGFNSFATPVVIKFLYILGLVVIGVTYVGVVIASFAQGAGYGLLVLVGGGVVALFYITFFRVFLEFYYAVVRMSEDIRAMRNRT